MMSVNESGNYDQFVPYTDETDVPDFPDHVDCSDICAYGGREATYCVTYTS